MVMVMVVLWKGNFCSLSWMGYVRYHTLVCGIAVDWFGGVGLLC